MTGEFVACSQMHRALEKTLKNWFVTPISGVHLDLADGLRGVAILMVVCCHGFFYNPAGPKALAVIGKIMGAGWIGVPLFFGLSGFLISLPFFQRRQSDPMFWYVRGYATRRFLKIFPPFYAIILLLGCFYLWHYKDPQYVTVGLAWASGAAHFVPMPINFNLSFWSLWIEVGFYIVLPFLFFATRGLSVRTTGWVLFFVLLLGPLLTRTLLWQNGLSPAESLIVNNRFPNALDNFAWGVWFASFYVLASGERVRWKWLGKLGYLGVALLGLSIIAFSTVPDLISSGRMSLRMEAELKRILPLFSMLILFLIFDPGCWMARALSAPWLRFLGLVSYEWFLIHQPVQTQFREWMGSAHGNLVRFLFTVGAPSLFALGISVALYQVFSLPILRWGRNRTRTPKTGSPSELPSATVK